MSLNVVIIFFPIPSNQKPPTDKSDIQKTNSIYSCDFCGKEFNRKRNIYVHVQRHFRIQRFECLECSKPFRTRDDLHRHKFIHSNSNVKKFACEICEKRFVNRKNLVRHKSTHLTERNFICGLCQKSFKTGKELKMHDVFPMKIGDLNVKIVIRSSTLIQS
jgi:uncharacterized Zn-finger protein